MEPTLFDASEQRVEELLPLDGSAVLHRSAFVPDAAFDAFEQLLDKVPWEQRHVRVFGREVAQPRLVAWFGDPGAAYTYSGLTLDALPWLPSLAEIKATCEWLAGATFNSGLANLYRDGHDSVAWHADDEPELGPDPVIASASFGAERRFDLRHRETGETVRTLLPTGSVVVMSRGCQRNWLHQVPKMLRVREPRINLTFRRFSA
jgi:alkylated DNA repair dioxygenase AlkB